MSIQDCIARLTAAAGRTLSDQEVEQIFERLERVKKNMEKRGPTKQTNLGFGAEPEELVPILQEAATQAAKELEAEAARKKVQAQLQLVKLGARDNDVQTIKAAGFDPLQAVERTIVRDYSGRLNVTSMEQTVAGYKTAFTRKLAQTWDALGESFFGLMQDRTKLESLIRELRGEDSGDAVAKQGAKAFLDVAEEARVLFNRMGGDIGKLSDWGMPQHHSQGKVAEAGKEAWVQFLMPRLNRERYTNELGQNYTDAMLADFLGRAWDSIATDGLQDIEPGQFVNRGKITSRHAEHREIHFKDATAHIEYWEAFGEKTIVEILLGHVEALARDIAMVEHYGPNPQTTFRTLRDAALQESAITNPKKLEEYKGRALKLSMLFNYATGQINPSASLWLSRGADAIANLNVAGKLGSAAIASFIGDKPMMEAVAHMNNIPAIKRWGVETSLLNPVNSADRALLKQQGLMLDSLRSGLLRFYEGLGETGWTGKFANGVMKITGMQAINDIRKGAFGLSMFAAIGQEIASGKAYAALEKSDVRALRHLGVTEPDWNIWRLAELQKLGAAENTLTPDAIARIPTDTLVREGIVDAGGDVETAAADARRRAIVKLLGVVNTEADFAIVTPGWKERALFYSDLQRGTVKGEISRSWLQFKSFPWAYFQRGMDAIANQGTPASKAAMVAYLIVASTMAGAMLQQTREMLMGKDPRKMFDENWLKFWLASFIYGGALGIYGDFLYSANETRFGSGPVEALAGPTIGPMLELTLVQPLAAAKKRMEGEESDLARQTIQDLKGFIPGSNIWYTKAALDHMIWHNVSESLAPGYLRRMRSRTLKEYGQEWWWEPGEAVPDRAPDIAGALGAR